MLSYVDIMKNQCKLSHYPFWYSLRICAGLLLTRNTVLIFLVHQTFPIEMLSDIAEPISTKYGVKHHWVERVQICSYEQAGSPKGTTGGKKVGILW